MESNGNNRAGLLSAGGVLSIISGILQIISVVSLVAVIFYPDWFWYILDTANPLRFIPIITGHLLQFIQYRDLGGLWPVIFAVIVGVLAIVAIVGGISAIRRKRYGLSLAGAICAIPYGFSGILALIFIVLGKRAFKAKEIDAEVV